MSDEDEIKIELGEAELVVPRDAVTPDHEAPTPVTNLLDPTELFAFLATITDWPTNGYTLYLAALREGASPALVKFFEGLPGSFDNEADIAAYAEDPAKPPYGEALDVGQRSAGTSESDSDELSIGDVTDGSNGT